MYWDDELRQAVIDSVYVHRASKSEIVRYYKETFTGKEGRSIAWKKHLISDILAQRGITPDNTDAKEYKRQSKNVGKRFEAQRIANAEPKNKAEYESIGKTLPKIPPKDINYTVHVSGVIRISNNCKPVDFNVTIGGASNFSIQGENAANFTDNPNVYDLVEAYFYGDPGYDGWCESPTFEIS